LIYHHPSQVDLHNLGNLLRFPIRTATSASDRCASAKTYLNH
jgi:hypothetical protein